ncbi:helix-turn-helix domain-containing protein [Paenibacillus gallinarum]|uniref:Helix-turn-helix transcriptional regulator n=1 Tax=Paenibacillus gallinarum TaxID=2762232 RepID=A0ABR8T2G6_9BACL|nr:AraC family transcriptional regulator [Paenibacillus gallinarum]MBD7969961.1 helix-turn-helix transcriptional regulator [Paenibacillus gallinarum]
MVEMTTSKAAKVQGKQLLDSSVVKLKEVLKVSACKKWNPSDMNHHSSHLLMVAEGQGCLTWRDCSFPVDGTCIYSCMNEEKLVMDCKDSNEVNLTIIGYDVYQQDDQKQHLLVSEVPPVGHLLDLSHHEVNWFTDICNSIYGHWHSGEGLGRYRSQLLFQEALYWIAKSSDQARADTDSALQLTKDYIDQHYTESLPLDKLCRMAGLSLKYYSELFKKHYGVSVTEYIATVRMEHAKRLMMDPELKLREIAHLVGYPDEFYFSRKFKKMMGTSPSAYRTGAH